MPAGAWIRLGWLALPLAALAQPARTAPEFAGSKSCSGCHRALYDRWVASPMGRSVSPAQEHLAKARPSATVTNDKQRRSFEVFVDGGRLMQAESGEGFRHVQPVSWAIGSGVNGFSFVVQRGDHLFQAPLSYYSKPGRWELSPGYEFADYGFNRPIAAGCISCHSGAPNVVPDRSGLFEKTPFRELAIGCENCHGPGARHIAAKGARSTIVNPKRLPADRADEICMNCHQGGDTRILQPGKTERDFRPGMTLNDVVAIFKLPRNRDNPADADLLEHHESMRLSQCFRATAAKAERLSCGSCHNPHAVRTDYRQACLGCHTAPFPATHPARESDCVSCHMPKRDVQVIAHSALTNHRIVRTRDQPLPAAAFSTAPIVHFNAVPGQTLPLLTRLQAYGQLSDQQPALLAPFQQLLDEAARAHPDDPLVLGTLGRRALRSNQLEDAVRYLTRSVERGSVATPTFEDLGEALAKAGRLEDAVLALRRGIELSPYAAVLYKSLALRLIKLQRYPEAKQTLEKYVELFPEDDFIRRLLAQVSGTR
ncbi:MAG: hypothetical protein NTZ56_17425 [Acidobacteria bacterium]|nr:hypothetical protein [Acidobacteriota bacterium]